MAKNKVTDLKFDERNFNKGTEYGKSLMNKSFEKFGAGRSILIDKNNNIIAGNKSAETFAELGLEDVEIVESDGKKLIAVKRTDIDLNTPEGRELALADNQTAKTNIDFDFEVLESELEENVIEEWGLCFEDVDYSGKNKELDLSDFENQNYTIKLEFTEDDYNYVKDKITQLGQSPEKILYDALVSL